MLKHFASLFVAYLCVWAIFFVYEITVARRLSQLREELKRLKERFRENSKAQAEIEEPASRRDR